MKVLNKVFLFFILFLSVSNDCICQKQNHDEYKMVIVFNSIYQTNLVELGGNYYNNIYLLTSDKPIEKVLSAISDKHYGASQDILDTLKNKLKVFVVKRNLSDNSFNRVTETLKNANYYLQGYLFFMDQESNKYGPVRYYIIKQHAFCNIQYTILNQKGGDFNREDTAVINKMERCP